MKYYDNFRSVLLMLALFLMLGISTEAQKRNPPRSNKSVSAGKTKTATNAETVKQASQTVSNQIKNLAQFIYIYGGSLTRIQLIDQEARQGRLSDSARKQSEGGKQGLILTVRTFKNAMLKLEDDFRNTPALHSYLLQLTGVGETASTAEEQATAGQFEQSGRTLLEVLNQLTDTLQAMH